PSYNPTVVYGAPPAYAYPPIAYPAYPAGAVAATAAISFGVGVAMGAFWGGCCGGGGWGWKARCGGNNRQIHKHLFNPHGYNNATANRNVNKSSGGSRPNIGSGNSSWQHNPQHRRSTPYSNANTARQFGGSTRNSAGGVERFDGRGQNRAGGGQSGGALNR